jgi:hypothetical protein
MVLSSREQFVAYRAPGKQMESIHAGKAEISFCGCGPCMLMELFFTLK